MKEIRKAVSADVDYKTAKEFTANVKIRLWVSKF